MMWDVVTTVWLAMLRADSVLTQALGGDHILAASAGRTVRVPSVEWLVLDDRETELFNPITVQVDIFARGVAQAAAIEGRVRQLTHRDTMRTLPGTYETEPIRLWTRYIDGRWIDYPAEQGVVHRSLDFLFEPLRALYHHT